MYPQGFERLEFPIGSGKDLRFQAGRSGVDLDYDMSAASTFKIRHKGSRDLSGGESVESGRLLDAHGTGLVDDAGGRDIEDAVIRDDSGETIPQGWNPDELGEYAARLLAAPTRRNSPALGRPVFLRAALFLSVFSRLPQDKKQKRTAAVSQLRSRATSALRCLPSGKQRMLREPMCFCLCRKRERTDRGQAVHRQLPGREEDGAALVSGPPGVPLS